MSIRKGKTIIAGNASSLDWTGTLAEYNIALEDGTIKPDMICHITDDEQGGIIPEYGSDVALLDIIVSNQILEGKELIGKALQGSMVLGSEYPDAYNKLVTNKNKSTSTQVTETIGDIEVTYTQCVTGYKILTNKTVYDQVFEATGTANFFVLDETNRLFYLPKTTNFLQPSVSQLGGYNEAGLPNITGSFDVMLNGSVKDNNVPASLSATGVSGAFYGTKTVSTDWHFASGWSTNTNGHIQPNFDASRSNKTYGKSTTVQPQSTNVYIYYKIGNTIQANNIIDLEAQVLNLKEDVSDKLNDNTITNCITEIPQRIKYTLESGTLTIKAGSVVIVPYGTEDKTSQYPKGATFINNNFKVYDTQFTDGKFFVWAEVVSDIVSSPTSSGTLTRFTTLNLTTNTVSSVIQTESGVATNTQSYTYNYTGYYNTSTNLVGYTDNSTTIIYSDVRSLHFMSVIADGTYMYGSVKQVFQGMGYIGSTIWADKEIKCLAPNGRNLDGTLNNVVTTRTTIALRTLSGTNDVAFLMNPVGSFDYVGLNTVEYTDKPSSTCRRYYSELDNYWYNNEANEKGKTLAYVYVGTATINSGVISNFQPKLPFRAVDYNDFADRHCTTKATTTSTATSLKPAVVVQNYVNGSSWYRVWSDGWIEQGGLVVINKTNSSFTGSVTLIKNFTNTNYTITHSSEGTGLFIVNLNDLTTSGFTVYQTGYSSNTAENARWYACGY